MKSASSKLRLNILSDPANLAGTRQAIEALCAENGLDKKSCDEVGLCVNEARANVMRHAYEGATDKPIEVAADAGNGAVRIAIRDWGNGVNPLDRPLPPPNPLKPGGLGMVCLRQMMDELTFTPQRDGMLLEMTKRKKK